MDPQLRDAILPVDHLPRSDPADTASPDAVVRALYEVLSGPAEHEQPRDWGRLRTLFLPGARLVLTRWRSPAAAGTNDGPPGEGEDDDREAAQEPGDQEVLRSWDVEGFVAVARATYDHPFFEEEVARREERFGAVAHVFSTYESRVGSRESEPVVRGINSVQLVRTGGRWWIAHLVWDVEGPDRPIPERYLPRGG